MLNEAPAWQRVSSVNIAAFLAGQLYYDAPTRDCYAMAVMTSLLYGEDSVGGTRPRSWIWPPTGAPNSGNPLRLRAAALR